MIKTCRLLRYFSLARPQPISWREYFNVIEIIIYVPMINKHTINVIGENITFAQLQNKQAFRDIKLNFPKEIDPAMTRVVEFFVSDTRPLKIQAYYLDQIHQLPNRRQEKDSAAIIRGLQNQRGIYKSINFEQVDLGLVRRFLTIYYLKLQAQAYCRTRNYPVKTSMTDSLSAQILSYLNTKNQTSQQSVINSLIDTRQQIFRRIMRVNSQIQEIENQADRVVRLYKMGAIGLTIVHIGSFGYMVFGVQWLGWDIIEPLTFTVSTIYLYLALRFYRKYQKDRNVDSIRQRLRELALKPQKRMLLSSLKAKYEQELLQLKECDLNLKLARNRLSLSSTLVANR